MVCLRLHVLSSTTVLMGVASVLLFNSALAFDPNEGFDPSAPTAAPYNLPDPSVLYGGVAVAQPPPQMPLPMIAPSAGTPGYISPVPPMQMPPRPLYPERSTSAQPAAMPAAPQFPPVSPEVAARAQELMAQQPTTVATPVIAPITYAPAPAAVPSNPSALAVLPAPLSAATAMTAPPLPAAPPAAVPATELSDQTRAILSAIPAKVDTPKATKGGEVSLNRVTPEISAILGDGPKEEQFESVGLSIKVRRPGLDANYELNRAYTSLMGGDTEQAIGIYKDILSTETKNEDALFGLAATYHRLGSIDKARPLYGMLLKLNPNHREGLNNFLVLVADESPQDALPELERLEQRNPDFSPIPAQTAIVMDKLGYQEQARDKMLRAIELAPDNITYKYNLAIMLDHQGRYKDASALYKLLIEASLRGENVPATVDVMQKRLNFLTTAAVSLKPSGG